jgi:outer membrane protein assembly factor BamB
MKYPRRLWPLFLPLLATLVFLIHPIVAAADWPQVLGPDRNGRAQGERLLDAWPADGPIPVWKYELGSGFAGPVVAGSRVVIFHRVNNLERIEAIAADTGRSLWRQDFPASYRGTINPDSGPRATPLIHKDAVFAYGAAGDLHCVALADGQVRWSRNLLEDYEGDQGYFGAGSSPIVADGKLLVNVGGRRQAGLVALDLADGATVWNKTDERASYSSPTLASFGGETRAVFVTRLNTLGVNPTTGDVAFEFPFGERGPTVNGATPLVFNGHLFVTASYGIGARYARLTPDSAKVIWSSDDALSSQYATPVHHDGHIYGTHGREDVGVAELRCIEAATGKVRWSSESFGVAHVLLVQDTLLLLSIDGKLTVARATPAQFKPLGQWRVTQESLRAIPALADGQFYFRDNRGDRGTLTSLRVGAAQP